MPDFFQSDESFCAALSKSQYQEGFEPAKKAKAEKGLVLGNFECLARVVLHVRLASEARTDDEHMKTREQSGQFL